MKDSWPKPPRTKWSVWGDELDRVMRGNTVLHPCHGGRGGEWDSLRHILSKRPRAVNRRLVGARLLTPYGLTPDQAVHECIGPYQGIEDIDEAMEWYVRIGLLFIEDRQRIANFERHIKLAQRNGCDTYFKYRDGLSKLGGYRSYHHERTERWPT